MRIAVVDDDEATRAYLSQILSNANYGCTAFANGRDMMSALTRDTFDLVIVDWNMPGLNGIDIIKATRADSTNHIPIIMLTSRSDERDIVDGLKAGADDFITKPERESVILARVEALLRRTRVSSPAPRTHEFGAYTFDTMTHSVKFGADEIVLTAKEFALALCLFQNQHRALSRAYLLETIWNSVADLPTRTLDVHVSRIRTKLHLSRESGFRIQTIFGFGYRLEAYDELG
jgi:DNA-binding response OmpR family regulator